MLLRVHPVFIPVYPPYPDPFFLFFSLRPSFEPGFCRYCKRVAHATMDAIQEQFTLLSLGLFTIGVRMVVRTRSVGFSGWQLDDYLMPITGVSSPHAYLYHPVPTNSSRSSSLPRQ